MMFTSKTPRDLTNDPLAHVTVDGHRVNYPWLATGGTCDPRPEFDHVQHNPPNPILVRFREQIAKTDEHPYWGDNWDATMDYLDFALDFPHESLDYSVHVQHAYEVLTRLAALTKET